MGEHERVLREVEPERGAVAVAPAVQPAWLGLGLGLG